MKKIYTGLVLLASFSMATSVSADADEKKVEAAVSSSSVDQKVKEQLNGQKSKRVLAFENRTDQAVTVNGTKIEKKSKALISFGPEEVIVKAAFEGNPEKQISDLSNVPGIFQDEQISLAIITKEGDGKNLDLGIIYGDERQMPGPGFSFKKDPAVLGTRPQQYTFCNKLSRPVVVSIGGVMMPYTFFAVDAGACRSFFAHFDSKDLKHLSISWESMSRPTQIMVNLLGKLPTGGPLKHIKAFATSPISKAIGRMPLTLIRALASTLLFPVAIKNIIKLGRWPDSIDEILSKKQQARLSFDPFPKESQAPVPDKSSKMTFIMKDGAEKMAVDN